MPQLNELVTKLQISGTKSSQTFAEKVQKINPAVKVFVKPSKVKIKVKVK